MTPPIFPRRLRPPSPHAGLLDLWARGRADGRVSAREWATRDGTPGETSGGECASDETLTQSAPLVHRDPVIARLEVVAAALRDATAQQAKHIADVARAAEVYARRQQLGDKAIGYARPS